MYYIKVTNYYYTLLIVFSCLSKSGSNLLITSFNPILIFGWLEKYFEYWNIGFKKICYHKLNNDLFIIICT